ncbi:MAG: hypothetical protein AB7T27_02235 [Kiritimatiellia bacterium]
MLKKLSILTIAFLPLASSFAAVNLIDNPGFEIAGTDDSHASYWQYGQPDTHGERFGTASRRDWVPRSGSWHGAIQGTWSDGNDNFGGYWQEAPASPGMTYQASAWVAADSNWWAGAQAIKIEFFNSGYTNLKEFTKSIPVPSPTNNTQFTVSGVAPLNTAWARFVIYASDVGSAGAMRIDDVEMYETPPRTTDFNTWTTTITDGCHEFGGWNICTGRTTTINARSGYAATLPNPDVVSFNGNSIRSPYFENGIGNFSFWYRHGSTDTNEEPTEAVAFNVQVSDNGSSWSTIDSVTNVLWLSYRQYARALNLPNSRYIRIMHTGGSTNRLLIDDIAVANPIPLTRYQDFNLWTNAPNYGCHSSNNWIVCTGRITSVLADEGFSATLAPSPLTGFTNYLRTPLMEDGYGTITFRYARGTNNTGPAHLNLQSSPDGTAWTTIASVSNIISQSYTEFNQYFYHTNDAYLRILNIFTTNAGSSTILLDEGFDAAPEPPPDWTFSGIATYTSDSSSGDEPPSVKFDGTGDSVTTPDIASPTNLSFWLKGISTDASSSFLIEGYNGGWVTITNMTNLTRTEDAAEKSVNCSAVYTKIRFTYTKSAGNLAFDDLLITGLPPGPKPAQQLLLDQINIGDPELVRLQDFNSWPTMSAFGDSMYQGWKVHAGRVYDLNAYQGQSARLSKTVGDYAYIQSPYLNGGVGTISFQYARMYASGGTANPEYLVQISPNGSDPWTTLDRLILTSNMTYYTEYSRYVYETNMFYVRVWHEKGSAQDAIFDDLQCQIPTDPANMILNGWHDPEHPYTNDEVLVWAYITPVYGAQNWNITSYYRIGTSGAWTASAMTPDNVAAYYSVTNIPPQPTGTVVQYYISCSFTGPGSSATSPVFYPTNYTTSPAQYVIPRKPSGQVWINEINYNQFFDPEFIELAGPADFDIGGWVVEIYSKVNYYPVLAEYYPIPISTVFANEHTGYGFYVLSTSDMSAPPRDITLTNALSSHAIGGIVLRNEAGGIEYAISYGGVLPDFTRLPLDDNDGWDNYGLALSGTGQEYEDFNWLVETPSAGFANADQTFSTNVPDFVEMEILGFQFNSTITVITTGTNNWAFIPYYSTNLMDSSGWKPASVLSSTYANGTNTVTFTDPNLGGVNAFYRVLATP